MTISDIPAVVEEYLDRIEHPRHPVCRDQIALAAYVRKTFASEQLTFEAERCEKYLGLSKYYPWRLLPWEKFLIALWLCTYAADGSPRWRTAFVLVGRGSGKDGLISFLSFCLLSPYNPVGHYDVDICAMNEDQAMTPVNDLVEVLDNPKGQEKLKRHYYHTKEIVKGRKNLGKLRGRTNNPTGRDGMRSGAAIFNEVHAYQNYANIKVFVTGTGKVADTRIGCFTSEGEVNDGPLDDYKARANRILFDGENDKGFLPFICRLDDISEVDDPENWYKANPSLEYFPHLYAETEDEYEDWKQYPEQNGDFITKRMGIRRGFTEIAVTSREKLIATKKPLIDLAGRSCTVGIDYAELSDWAAVNLHFRDGDDRYDINHAWVCRDSKTLSRIKAPWRDWCDAGLCTFVEDVTISADLIAEYIKQAAKTYDVKKLAMDHYRWTLVKESFRKIGFDANDKERVKLIRPSDIMQVDPVIQEIFDRELFHWGDNSCLRWAANNVKRVAAGKKQGTDTGNYYYAKIEAKSRKTDPYMALVASVVIEDVIRRGKAELPKIGAYTL